MKFYEFIRVLNQDEIHLIKKTSIFENKQLGLLCLEMIKVDEIEFKNNKNKIYRKVFEHTYTSLKDANLRAKISEMYTILHAYFLNYWKKQKIKLDFEEFENYLLLLIERGALELFDREWHEFFSQLDDKVDIFYKSRMYHLLTKRTILKPISEKMYEEYLDSILNYFKYLLLYNEDKEQLVKYSLINTNNIKRLHNIGQNIDEEFINQFKQDVLNENPHPFIMVNKFLIETQESAKSNLLNSILKYALAHKETMDNNLSIISKCIFNYSVELSLNDKFEESNKLLQFLEINDLVIEKDKGVFYFNFSSNLIKLKKWDEAEKYNNQLFLMSNVSQFPFYNNLRIRQVLLKVIRKEFDQFYAFYNEVRSTLKNEDQIMYLRLVFSIYLFETGDCESAERECANMKKSPYFNTVHTKVESQLLKMLLPIYHIYTKNIKGETQNELNNYYKKLKSDDFYLKSPTIINVWIQNFMETKCENFKEIQM